LRFSLEERLASFGHATAMCWQGQSYSYEWLGEETQAWSRKLQHLSVAPGECAAIVGDYSPRTCSLLLALILNRNIIVPLGMPHEAALNEQLHTAEVSYVFSFTEDDTWQSRRHTPVAREHPLLHELRNDGEPGLILFSSGSTGESKASLLNVASLLDKFSSVRRGYRTLVFLLLDHIGGINTLLHILTQGGTAITSEARTADAVCACIEAQRVELLPTTPTFLNMLLISDAHQRFDLSSLRLITYGTEPMPVATLRHLHEALPNVTLKQTYGLTELGILPTQSRSPDELWIRLDRRVVDYKIVDNILWVRCQSAMLGYLNAPSPFDEEGWLNTQDVVEVDGEYLKILGRKSDIINVGGEKVFPAEVEGVLLQMDGIREALVVGKPNPVTGQVVVARVAPSRPPEDPHTFAASVRAFCGERLQPYKIPMLVEIVDGHGHTARFKKLRPPAVPAGANGDLSL
jgi:long-chain acyl-CoA synthetase